MELKLDSKINEKEIVYYILSLIVFLSSFYISVNLLVVHLVISLVLFDILILISSIYIFNIEKYSLFDHDIIFFQSMFYIFSLIYLISSVKYVLQEQYNYLVTWLIICGMLLLSVNYIILGFKQNSLVNHPGFNILFILISYTYIIFVIILGFSWMYISDTKSSVNEYINVSFKNTQARDTFTITDYFSEPESYLSYEKLKIANIFVRNDFDQKKMREYIKARFAPVDRLEDFILYSTENCFGGINIGIAAEGAKIKYELIAQKFLFLLITLVTVVNLSSKWRIIDN